MKKKLILYVAMASLLCWASVGVWSGRTLSNATGTDPSNTDQTDPSDTDQTDPSTPGTTDPSTPGTADPSDTDQTDPSTPGTTDPSTPGTTDPSTPGTTGPSTPGTTDPATPGTQNPATPGTNESSNPNETNPSSTEPTTSSRRRSSGGSSSSNDSGNASAGQAETSSMGLPTTVDSAVEKALNQGAGSTVVLDTSKVLTGAELRKVAEAGGRLTVFCGPGISWHFASLTNPGVGLNPNVDIGANIPEITSRLNGVPGIAIRFMHNGVLPGTAYVGLQVPFAEGTTLYFYYYNRSTQLFEFQQTTTVAQGGYAVVALTHCSDYVLTTAPMTSGVANGPVPTTKNAGRLDGTPHTGI